MIVRYLNSGDGRMEISHVYEQSWKSVYKDICPKII